MHGNLHFAVGVIIAGLSSYFISLNFWTFAFIVFCAIAPDFDIPFIQYARDENHRNLFTHSIYISLILLVIGFIFQQWFVVIGGLAYLSHLSIDLFDWGTDLFYTHNTRGYRYLFRGHEEEVKQNVNQPAALRHVFFYKLYYSSKLMLLFELIACISMILILWLIVPNLWFFIFGYLVLLGYHLLEYYEYKLALKGKKLPIKLLDH